MAMAFPLVVQAAEKPGIQSFAAESYVESISMGKKLIMVPVVIVCIILIIAALIAVGNGAYTMGTLITFLIGAGGLYGVYWFTQPETSKLERFQKAQLALLQQQAMQQQYQQPQYQQQYQQPQYQQQYQQPQYQQRPQQYQRQAQQPLRRPQYQSQVRQGEGEEFVSDEVNVKKEEAMPLIE